MRLEFQKIINLLDISSDDKGLLLKNGMKYTINQKIITMLIKKLELKHQFLDQIYVILVRRILL